jgi:dihydrofolate reductase
MPSPYRITGYAIVSSDGMIADAHAFMPDSLKIEADKEFFSRELDHVDMLVHGRHSHECQTNSPLRRRLILTRNAAGIAPDYEYPNALLWNPAGASLEAACRALGLTSGVVAVLGGTEAFDMFLGVGYQTFHLSRVDNVKLPGGRPVFSPVGPHRSPEDLLAHFGLEPGPTQSLDPAHALSLVTWTRKAPT